jgi:hypothetical protein
MADKMFGLSKELNLNKNAKWTTLRFLKRCVRDLAQKEDDLAQKRRFGARNIWRKKDNLVQKKDMSF